MSDPNEAPSPAALREMAEQQASVIIVLVGEALLHPAELSSLARAERALRACATALEAKDREIAELSAWQVVAAESNIAVDSYLRSIKPDLPKHYGMPLDGIRIVVSALQARVEAKDREIAEEREACARVVERYSSASIPVSIPVKVALFNIAGMIRARGKEPKP